MDFFNSLAQVAKNQKNFKTWEQEQQDRQAQRDELYRQHQYSNSEIAGANSLGQRIMDVVDIMDNHSENVAENVETAVQPLVAFLPLIPTALAGFIFYKTGLIPLKTKSKKIYNQLKEDKNVQLLVEQINEERRNIRQSANEIDAVYLLRKANVERIKDPELRRRALEIHNKYSNILKPVKKALKRGLLGVVATSVLSFMGATIMAAKLQVDSSKIARFQARKILDDPKNFVNYTPEQIEEAKKYIEEHPELKKQKKKEKLNSGMVKSIIGVLRDRRAYLKEKANDKDTSQKVTRVLSKAEIEEAQRDKDIIQRTVRIMNNEAEKYSENMEVAANVIMGTTPIMGALTGWLLGVVLNKSGFNDRKIVNYVNTYADDNVKESYEHFKKLNSPKDPGYTVRWAKFINAVFEQNIKVEGDTAAINSKKLAKKELAVVRKRIMTVVMSHKWANSKILGLLAGTLSAVPAALVALGLQKSSARAGRFTAKRELEKNPQNFIGYTDEEYNKVKDIKGHKQTFGERFKEYALFIPTVLKQYWAYNKYKRTEFKEHQLLNEQLQKLDVTDEQMRDAKNLQRKLFNTFEKVDDNSQLYSESMEAATEIAQPLVINGAQIVIALPLIYGAIKLIKGKQSPGDFFVKASDKLANASNLLKSKFFKKYLESIDKNIPQRVGDQDLKFKPLSILFKDVDFKNGTISDVLKKLFVNLQSSADVVNKMNDYEQISTLRSYRDTIKKILNILDVNNIKSNNDAIGSWPSALLPLNKVVYFLDELCSWSYTPTQRADMLSVIVGAKQYKLNDSLSKEIPQNRIREAKNNLANILNKINREYDERFTPDVIRYKAYNLSGDKIPVLTKDFADDLFNALDSGVFDKIKFTDIPKLFNVFRKNNISPESILKAEDVLPANFVEELKNVNQLSLKQIFKRVKEQYRAKSEEEINAMFDRFGLGSMDKPKLMKIMDNFEKIIENIPSAELEKIKQTLLKSLKENPDEFVKYMFSGGVVSVFITPMLAKTAAAAGISWVALNILVAWMIETWLADMQLKAGRLGVMKAMEALDDPAYYADIEPEVKQENKTAAITPQNGKLLDKFKK